MIEWNHVPVLDDAENPLILGYLLPGFCKEQEPGPYWDVWKRGRGR